MSFIRLDQFLAVQCGCSRRQAKDLIRAGRVSLNGGTVQQGEKKLDPTVDKVMLDGRPVIYREHLYLMMNKPAGVLCVSDDPQRRTVVDLVPENLRRRGLFPAGRLDRDSTGFVVLTDDGEFAHRMLSPRSHVPKKYLVRVDAPVTPKMQEAFARGTSLADGTVCLPAGIRVLEEGQEPLVEVVLQEGRYHQIKRMLGTFDVGVNALHRFQIGAVVLDPALAPGQCRELTCEERDALLTPAG